LSDFVLFIFGTLSATLTLLDSLGRPTSFIDPIINKISPKWKKELNSGSSGDMSNVDLLAMFFVMAAVFGIVLQISNGISSHIEDFIYLIFSGAFSVYRDNDWNCIISSLNDDFGGGDLRAYLIVTSFIVYTLMILAFQLYLWILVLGFAIYTLKPVTVVLIEFAKVNPDIKSEGTFLYAILTVIMTILMTIKYITSLFA
jgi:hypothetical protein